MIQVLDHLCEPGSAARVNDDALGWTADAAFVLDGATGLADAPLLSAPSDARWVADAGVAALTTHMNAAAPLRAIVSAAAAEIEARFVAERLRAPAELYEIPWSSMMLARLAGARLDMAWFGDCQLILDTGGIVSNFGPRTAHRESEQKHARRWSDEAARSGTTLREAAMSFLRAARSRVNQPGGHGALGPDANAAAFMSEASVALGGEATALLMSDGFYALVADYGRYDDASLIAAASGRGLKALYAELRGIEDGDPAGARYPRFKKSDDATALLVRATPAARTA